MFRFMIPSRSNFIHPTRHPERSEGSKRSRMPSGGALGFFATLRMTLAGALCALGLLLAATPASAADNPLAGSWRIDLARSTELSPWKDYELSITTDGDQATLRRRLAWGRREFSDAMTVNPVQPVDVPVAMWPDNRHLGAYIGGDRTKRVRAEWLDSGRVLRLSTDLVLDTQQGARSVNILSDYKVTANGSQLILTELRSTRNRPVVYVFTRAK